MSVLENRIIFQPATVEAQSMPFDMNSAKYCAPELPAVVRRERLIKRLQAGAGQRLVIITGQAAQGKSTLAAEYLAGQSSRAAWLHLDAKDAGRNAFLDQFKRAIAKVVTAAPPARDPAPVRATGTARWESELTSLWLDLPDDMHMVLDGLEKLPAKAPAHALIQHMIALAAQKGRLFILSRQTPPYKLQQWIMQRRIVCIDNAELAFTAREIQAYFSTLYKVDLPVPCAQRLKDVTGGWTGGLVLIGQSLSRRPGNQWIDILERQLPAGFEREFLDFFGEEILAREPPRQQSFLMQIAVMDDIDPQILDDLAQSETRAWLDDLVQRNMFIQVLPGSRSTPMYRLNRLFRDFLRSKFQTGTDTADQVRIYEKTAGLYLQRRKAEVAVGLYLKANNFTAAARSIKKVGTDLVIRGHFAELEKALAALPAQSVKDDPWLFLFLTLTRRIKGGLRNIDDFQSVLAAFEDQNDIRGQLFTLAYLIEALVFTGHDPMACRTWISRGEALLAAHSDPPYFTFGRTLLWLQIGLAYITGGLDLTRGISAARTAYLLAHKIKDPHLMANAKIVSVLGLASTGDFEQADQALDKIAAFADTDAYTEYHALRSLVNVELALHRGDLASAREQLEPAAQEIETFGLLFLYPTFIDATGFLQIYAGQYDAARSTCRHLLDVAVLSGNPNYEGLSHRLSALRHYFRGSYFEAEAAALNALDVFPEAGQPTLHGMRTQQLTGLIECHQAKYAQAGQRLQQARQYFSATGNFLSLCETDLSLALVHDKLGRKASMVKCLRDGFSLAADRQYDHFVILCPSDLETCCRLALDCLDEAAAAWPGHLLSAKFPASAPAAKSRRPESESYDYLPNASHRRTFSDGPFLQIHTLGTFRVLRNGDTLIQDHQWGGRRIKMLLKAILVHGLQDIPKDILIEDLWPEGDPLASLRNFKVTLHRLRKILEPDLGKHSRSAFIRLKDNLICLDKNRCWVDAQAFVQLCKDVKRAALARENQAILALGSEALALYQGDFLPEDPYAPWAEMKRLALKDEYIATAMTMAEIHRSQYQWDAAADCCRSVLAADPCQERAAAILMEILSRQERRSDALKIYEQLRATLEKDLGVEPDPAVAAIYKQICGWTGKN